MTRPVPAPALCGDWWRHTTPFVHFRAAEVFDPDTYAGLASAFAHTAGEARATQAGLRAARNPNYDADIISLNRQAMTRFEPLLSAGWIDDLHRLIGLPNHRRIDAALHSSAAGSRTGWIHTDLCAAWFDDPRPGDSSDFILPDRSACEYFTGKALRPEARPREYARAAALIYYLGNDGWRPGDGGETAFYSAKDVGPNSLVETIAPRNNSLILFPCSPHSYHRFIGNPGRRRDSIILWLHTTIEDATGRWGTAINRRAAR